MLHSDVMKYKIRVIDKLCSNQDIIQALKIEQDEEIVYNYIYPYIYIPGVEETVRSVIGFALDFPQIMKNEYFKDANLIFYAICHRDAMTTDFGGTRTDLLEGLIINEFNWNVDLGLELELKSSTEIIISDHYYARKIVFRTLKFNSLDDGIKHNLFK